MTVYGNNMSAMNAAKRETKALGHPATEWKKFFKLEKLDGAWHVQMIPLQEQVLQSSAPLQAAVDAVIESAPIIAEDKTDEVTAAAAQADRIADQLQTNEQLPNGKVWVHKSSILKPTKQVWHIADEMVAAALAANRPAPTRKEVQDECVRRGIASGTARTQYQAWKKANDDSAANSAAAAAASARFNSK